MTVTLSVPTLFAASLAVMVMMLVPGLSGTDAVHESVPEVEPLLPVARFDQVTLVTPTLSVADPARDSGVAFVLYVEADGDDREIALFAKKITNAAGEPSTYTLDINRTAVAVGAVAIAFRGVDTTTPYDVAIDMPAACISSDHCRWGSNEFEPDTRDETTVNDNTMLVFVQYISSTALTVALPEPSFTNAESSSATDMNFSVDYDIFETAGTIGVSTYSNTGGDSAAETGTFIHLLREQQ